MPQIMVFILGLALTIIVLILYIKYKKDHERKALDKREREEEERLRLVAYFSNITSKLKSANRKFQKQISFRNGYFSNYQLYKWIDSTKQLFNEINIKPYNNIKL